MTQQSSQGNGNVGISEYETFPEYKELLETIKDLDSTQQIKKLADFFYKSVGDVSWGNFDQDYYDFIREAQKELRVMSFKPNQEQLEKIFDRGLGDKYAGDEVKKAKTIFVQYHQNRLGLEPQASQSWISGIGQSLKKYHKATALALGMVAVAIVSGFGSVWAQGKFLTLALNLPLAGMGYGILGLGLAANLFILRPLLKKALGSEFSRPKSMAFMLGLLGVMVGITVAFPNLYALESLSSAASLGQVLASTAIPIAFAGLLVTGFVSIYRAGTAKMQAEEQQNAQYLERFRNSPESELEQEEVIQGSISTRPEVNHPLDEKTSSYADINRTTNPIVAQSQGPVLSSSSFGATVSAALKEPEFESKTLSQASVDSSQAPPSLLSSRDERSECEQFFGTTAVGAVSSAFYYASMAGTYVSSYLPTIFSSATTPPVLSTEDNKSKKNASSEVVRPNSFDFY